MRESFVEQYLADRVVELGGEIRKVKWIGRSHAPDRRVMIPGRCMWVEVKAPGEKARPGQAREHERMRNAGETVVVIDSVEGVDALLAQPVVFEHAPMDLRNEVKS